MRRIPTALPTADGTRGQVAAVPAASSTLGFMASMGVVYTADKSFAGVGGVPKSPRSKVRTRTVLNAFMIHLKSECFPPRMHVRRRGLSNSPTYSAIGTSC